MNALEKHHLILSDTNNNYEIGLVKVYLDIYLGLKPSLIALFE